MEPLTLTPNDGGWLHADWGDGAAWLRFAKDDQDKLTRIVEMRTYGAPAPIIRVPLRRIQAAVTMRGAGPLVLALVMRINETADAKTLSGPPDTGMVLEHRYKLTRPPGKSLGPTFHRDVAHAYQSAIAFGLNPRKAIVEDTGATDSTVTGWVQQARKKGYLPPSTKGKITATPITPNKE